MLFRSKGFSGFFNHVLVMGPMSAISLILISYNLINNNKNLTKRWRNIHYIAIIFCFLTLLMSSSRAAIAGLLAGILLFLYKYYQARFSKFLSAILILLLFVIASSPVWSDYTEGIQKKQRQANELKDMTASRSELWNSRLEEFNASPLFGIGFATLDITKPGSTFQANTGSIEPGSSWLAILSMVGIVGFIPIFLIFVGNLDFLLRDRRNPQTSALLLGLIIFFVIHMIAEGYFFASGSFLCFYVWLLLGVIEVFKRDPSIRII